MAKKLILLDPGHGGLLAGQYQTQGKRHGFDSTIIFEGVLNRVICAGIAFFLSLNKIPCQVIVSDNKDITLKTRVERVNKLTKTYNCFLLSIHHNAFQSEKVNGFELFTYYGHSKADEYAEMIGQSYEDHYPNRKIRRSHIYGRISKEAPFYILKKTKCPAVLSEWAFMTNREEYERICSPEGINEQIEFYTKQLMKIYKQL